MEVSPPEEESPLAFTAPDEPVQEPQVMYQAQLSQLQDMGFGDREVWLVAGDWRW